MDFGDELEPTTPASSSRNSTRSLAGQSPVHRASPRRSALRVQGLARAPDSTDHNWARHAAEPSVSASAARAGCVTAVTSTGRSISTAPGVDDLSTRGNGDVKLPPNFNSFFRVSAAARRRLGLRLRGRGCGRGGLARRRRDSLRIEVEPRYFLSDELNVPLVTGSGRLPDWLVWQQDTLFGSFNRHQTKVSAGFSWIMTNRHELRLKLQANGLDAELRQAYRVDAAGNSEMPTDEPVRDLINSDLGLQIRYGYELRTALISICGVRPGD